MVEDEKTLLQQIRDKEKEISKKIDAVRLETEETIATTRREAEKIVLDAEESGKSAAEELYSRENAKSRALVEEMKKKALTEVEAAKIHGERGLNSAVDIIVRYVTMS